MAWDWYLNMEPIALEVAKSHAKQMTESNFLSDLLSADEGDLIPDDDAFLNNLKLGFVAIVMASCFYESSLNTFLREKMGFDPAGGVVQGNEDIKLEILFRQNEDALALIKGTHYWRNWQRVKGMRNALIHYKNNCPNIMSTWPPFDSWAIGKELIASFFIKSNIESLLQDVETLVDKIACSIDMTVSPCPIVFGADGRCGIGSYYCTRQEAALALEMEPSLAQEM